MMMKMYFHFRIGEPILFREWMATNMTGWVLSSVQEFSFLTHFSALTILLIYSFIHSFIYLFIYLYI
ncbi:hypothetical protein Y032_0049g1746 [Ancylostoma ceylanicum]|uniref:Uncharacterized protein n=1 Tax=Ancylostoma ceylanicum TaxID=53326 RepID=A0A016U9B6_9BILA|nr:hypothetical protein Y032_0049g1746 [Ancylostoma ceylanicum]